MYSFRSFIILNLRNVATRSLAEPQEAPVSGHPTCNEKLPRFKRNSTHLIVSAQTIPNSLREKNRGTSPYMRIQVPMIIHVTINGSIFAVLWHSKYSRVGEQKSWSVTKIINNICQICHIRKEQNENLNINLNKPMRRTLENYGFKTYNHARLIKQVL